MLQFLFAILLGCVSGRCGSTLHVTDGLGISQAPRVACGTDGAVHILWRNDITGIWEVGYRSYRNGIFSPPRLLSSLKCNSLGPVPALGPDNRLHAAWCAEINGTYEILYTAADSNGVFSQPLNISADAGPSTEPALRVDGNGVCAAWRNGTSNGDEIFSRMCQNGVWTVVTNVSRLTGISCAPATASGPGIVWSDDSYGSWNVYIKKYRKGKWRRRQDVYDGHYDGRTPAVCGSGDTLHLCWVQAVGNGADIMYRRLDGDGWSAARNLSGNGMLTGVPRLASDGHGGAYAVWAEKRTDGSALYWCRLHEGAWSEPVRFGDGDQPGAPDVAAAPDGTAWAVWRAERDGRRQIYLQKLNIME